MWSSSYSETFTDLDAQRVWEVWSDVDAWTSWQDDLDSAAIEGQFAAGSVIRLKPKGGPTVRIDLVEVAAPRRFVDVTRFPLARMTDVHELVEVAGGVEVRNTLTITGPLAFVWRKLVAECIATTLPEQTARLVEAARLG